jgi:hypothetical protein
LFKNRCKAQKFSVLLDNDILLDIFTDLRDLETDLRQRRGEAEYFSESNEQKAKKRNMLQSDKVIAWIESEESQLLWIDGNYILSRTNFLMSFATPLAIDAACNYETIMVLKYFCSQNSASRNPCCTLMQALIVQILKQYPQILGKEGSKLSRSTLTEAAHNITNLWDIFTSCLFDEAHVNAHRIYIIIDSVDELSSGQADDYNTLMSRLNALISGKNKLIKVLLTARILPDTVMASEISNALSIPQRKWSLVPFMDELPMQHKFSEIQEGRCKTITFPEIMLLYPPKTVIYATEDGEVRAYVVYEISGMTETMPGRFDPLHLGVWSIDHNGAYFTKRYKDLTITQFSGSRAVTELRYVPAGYLTEESHVRVKLMKRGQWYWQLGSEAQLCLHHGTVSHADGFS